jgi:hypothetical protein
MSRFLVPLLLLLLLSVVAAGLGIQQGWIKIPPNWLPWGPPDLSQKPGWFARIQINSLAIDRGVCLRVLDRPDLRFTPIPDRRVDDRCGFENAVHATRMPVAFNFDATATCGLTAALYWYQTELEAAAERDLGARLIRIDQLGTFACRNVNSEVIGPRSEHATANAIDVAAFHLADGRTISVAADWGKPTAAGRFLKDARDDACGLFNAVLGPDYNRLHANHFHLDLGRYRVCR